MPPVEEPAPQPVVETAATPAGEPRRYGPLELARYRKDDGRSLTLFAQAADREPPQ
ncbi:MAG TPA: hypothetical protein VHT27_02840 [Solirubrobacteraceae bacterium]|jgi:hypothetical protein|nr:hypothetical protein [Solirubrobacteraceae bacterium]